jgi:hypothetical protein
MTLSLNLTTIDAGAASERSEFAIELTNSGGSTVTVTEISVPNVENGLFISGQQPPFDLDPAEMTAFTLIVRPVGARFFSGTWVFQTAADSVSATLSGERKILWPFPHNWASPMSVTLSFKTDIFVSRTGKEMRTATRSIPRKVVKIEPLLGGDDTKTFTRLLANAQASPVVLQDPTRSIALAEEATGDSIEVATVAPWIVEGAHLVVGEGAAREAVQILSVAGAVATLTRDLVATHASGTKVFAAWVATMPAVRADLFTDTIVEPNLTFDEIPGDSDLMGAGSQETLFNGREVFPWQPDWGRGLDLEISYPVDRIDHGYGRTEDFHPVDFSARLLKGEVVLSGDDLVRYEQFFTRMRGRAGEFYIASATSDLALVAGSEVAGYRMVRVAGSDIYSRLVTDSVHKAIEVKTPAGVERFVVQGFTLSGSNTILTLDRDWTAVPATWGKMSWLFASRFAGDDMSFEFLTTTLATVSLACIALEDL